MRRGSVHPGANRNAAGPTAATAPGAAAVTTGARAARTATNSPLARPAGPVTAGVGGAAAAGCSRLGVGGAAPQARLVLRLSRRSDARLRSGSPSRRPAQLALDPWQSGHPRLGQAQATLLRPERDRATGRRSICQQLSQCSSVDPRREDSLVGRGGGVEHHHGPAAIPRQRAGSSTPALRVEARALPAGEVPGPAGRASGKRRAVDASARGSSAPAGRAAR
mmetsp:Transcript_26731/g.86322  ORF Transcript_26731/g.86322 Transcript_26731/m.86322 type:complete len:222 (-) Transcript_26731:219-884(-)